MTRSADDIDDKKGRRRDLQAALTRSVVGALPVVGSAAVEAVDHLIPGQKIDRLHEYLKILDERLAALGVDQEEVRARLDSVEVLDLFEDGLLFASRALSDEARKRIANIIARSLSADEVDAAAQKKMLSLVASLSDPEVVILTSYACSGRDLQDFHVKHAEVLRTASEEIGAPESEVRRGALRAAYDATLVRLGLVETQEKQRQITTLGRLLLELVSMPEREFQGDQEAR